ncbi:hypothetical protein PUN28_008097 [Cardiocondyla obscurior]|uniref:Secreted protein n=1 Tax=Cardiocondyla obscurior TaxID=286306 RepID=A0AAW2FWP2_9HYME
MHNLHSKTSFSLLYTFFIFSKSSKSLFLCCSVLCIVFNNSSTCFSLMDASAFCCRSLDSSFSAFATSVRAAFNCDFKLSISFS